MGLPSITTLQGSQPYFENGSVYRQNRPTQRGSKLRVGRGTKAHSPPSHISKTVLASVHVGPPTCTVDRTIFELWLGEL